MDDNQELINDYVSGISMDKLVKMYGITRHFIEKILKSNGVYRYKKPISYKLAQQIIVDYKSGDSALIIGDRYGYSDASIFRVLKKYGIETRPLKLAKRKSIIDETFFDVIDCEEKAYIFGLLFADGNQRDGENCISITLQEDDKQILMFVNQMIQPGAKLYFRNRRNDEDSINRKNQYHIEIWNDIIANTLESYGLVPRKSFIKVFPEVILNASEDIQRHFIRGYYDGNGGMCFDYAKFEFKIRRASFYISTTYEMCESINDLLSNYLTVNKVSYVLRHPPNNYGITFNSINDTKLILDWLYKDATVYMPRKYFKYREFCYRLNGDKNVQCSEV